MQSITDAVGNTTSFTYDLTTNTTTVTNPDQGTVVTVSDATSYVYDPANRQTQITYPDSTT